MQAITVGTSATLLAPAGNRKFLHIYNNDSNPIYLCYDGTQGLVISAVSLTVASSGASLASVTVANAMGITPTMQLANAAFSPPATVASVNYATGVVTFTNNATLAANLNSGDVLTVQPITFSTANGFPLAAGGFIFLDNDQTHNHYNLEVWAISAAGGANVRVQGA